MKNAPASPAPAQSNPTAERPLCGRFTLRQAEDEHPVRAGKAVESLAARLLAAGESKRTEFVLLWPGTLRSLSLVHALATMSAWHEGDKRGRRTLVYPAKANFLQGLNHLLVDRVEVGRLAGALYEPPREVNKNVKVSLPDKDAFMTSLNSVKEPNGAPVHPTVGELLPHFYSDLAFEAWRPCDGDLLRNIKARLGDRDHTRSLNDGAIRRLAAPDAAPDALFALGWRTSPTDVELALRKLKRLGSPDAVLLDLTRGMRRGNPRWKANAVRFLEALDQVWPTEPPGVCIVSDEPHVRSQLLQELNKRSMKGSGTAGRLLKMGLPVVGVPCATTRDGILTNGDAEHLQPDARGLRVAFTDTEASEVIGLFDRLRGALKREEWQQPLAEAAAYLLRLASLPSSTRVLSQWLDQAGVPMAVRDAYTWPTYRAKLSRLAGDPEFPERGRLERLVARADRLWVNYENGTPFARQLADLIEEHTRGTERCCVVFTRPTARVLAERYFETYDGYPEGAGFEVLADCVRFITANTLASELGTRGKETVVFAGLDEESLRLLVTDPRISDPAYVLLTRRNAAYLKSTLKSVASGQDFSSLASRTLPLLAQLPDFPDLDERVLLTREDFVLPTFSFEQALSASIEAHEDRDPTAWELVLDSGQIVRRSPAAHVYVYDPLLSHTQTRGYKRLDVSDLSEGMRLFVMSGELRELTETALKEAGVPISNDKKFEEALRSYHRRILAATSNPELGGTLTDKARTLRQRMLSQKDSPKALPEEGTVRSWIDVERLLNVDFEHSKPQAPRHEAHFRAFAQALGLSDIEAIYFWKAVIRPLRGVRRADGRRVGDAYADMLLEPESMVVHQRLKPAVVSSLFSRAKENVYAIEAIKKPAEDLANE
ncbi:hypothetical protein AACH10_02835 [Ideonella sp. DXS22W]|uniref:Uncharacterized protein n=1 Tax=Pseudaquabacterium inlustre TaxID=2984192 RepID=A0ABU9CBA9_9BURK